MQGVRGLQKNRCPITGPSCKARYKGEPNVLKLPWEASGIGCSVKVSGSTAGGSGFKLLLVSRVWVSGLKVQEFRASSSGFNAQASV